MPRLGEECNLPPYYCEVFFFVVVVFRRGNLTCKTLKDFPLSSFWVGHILMNVAHEMREFQVHSLTALTQRLPQTLDESPSSVISLHLPPPQFLLSAQSPVACTVLKLPFYFMMVANSQ